MINQTESDAWFGFMSHKARISPPDSANKFDRLQLPDIRTAPHRPIAPFGARERTVGAPQALFATNTVRKKIRRGRTAPIGDWLDMIDYFGCDDNSVDYAFSKYVSLRLLGFHTSRLRLVWLVDEDGNHHAVATVFLKMQTFILDNRCDIIRTDDDFKDMVPFFSLNGACFYIHWNPNSSNSADAALCCIEKRLCKNQMLRH